MLPELGSFAIILALCFAILQIFIRDCRKMAVVGQFIFLAAAMLCLIISFLKNDLTVIYVREHSHNLLPLLYRIGAAWGGHEGSLLLWCLILSGWSILFLGYTTYTTQRISIEKILMVLGIISTGFISFLLFTSNPFQRNFPTQLITGNDLTPILQDPGLIFHPPMLYFGYVGFAIAFAFAVAALLEKKLSPEWARACRPWVILPWGLLSCGIVLGSWWAYRELGWGGWWSWDPVENASLLPWLAATALLHSLIVVEKRDAFKGWAILLAIITFALSLIGTMLVRSGVLVSVHTFASDPARGIYLLIYLTLLIGGALGLYATRIHYFYQQPNFKLFSRETFLLINSIFLITAVITILIGTTYPIVLDALNIEKISVGEPYFNTVFLPIFLPLLLLMGFVPHIFWQENSFKKILTKLRIDMIISILIGFGFPFLLHMPFYWLASIGVTAALWIIIATLHYAIRLNTFSWRKTAMVIAHIGIAITALGISINSAYSEERQIKLLPGQTTDLAGYQITFEKTTEVRGANFLSLTALFSVVKDNHAFVMAAEQRLYPQQRVLGKPAIAFNVWRDIYLALGAPLPNGGLSVRMYYKPFVRWIWCGGFLLLIGGLLSLLSRGVPRETD